MWVGMGRRARGGAGARESGGPPRSAERVYAVAPVQLEPIPAVQPKQWLLDATAAPSSSSSEEMS